MKRLLSNIFYSFPIQLFILHFRKFQVLLVFWYILGSTINSNFMKTYGADALFLSPEYLGKVNAFSAAIVGVALGVFVMSWNVTTFILHSKRCRFLATTFNPFLKYCLNNALLPLAFLVFYLSRIYPFDAQKELMTAGDISWVMAGLLGGFVFVLLISFMFFFGAAHTIQRTLTPIISASGHLNATAAAAEAGEQAAAYGMRVSYFLNTRFRFKKVRNVAHYSQNFLDLVFKRHHFSGMLSIMLAFSFLIIVGFFMDYPLMQVPAAASIFIFFAVMVAVIGALTYFLQSWSLLFVILFVWGIDWLYQREIIDPRNKAYGLNYSNREERPAYDKASLQALCTPDKIAADKAQFISVLENWKKKQNTEKPVMILINVSGGGLRSATFVMNTLQQLDSITRGRLMQHTFLVTGASGGMLAATYFRELYRRNLSAAGKVNLHNRQLTDNIAADLLNPMFSSMIARDIFAPAQKFRVGDFQYVKDRGYAFEEKLLQNSNGILDQQIRDYYQDEQQARIPLMIFNSTISRDGRQMMISSQPIRFLMKPAVAAADTGVSPDAVDFGALFARQSPRDLRLLTALRMNATFPYVLPNVWLPSNPVIDVMDAGLRDNFGQEVALRFVENFKDWIRDNTGGVVILQMRDRMKDNWQQPLETGPVTDVLVKPATMLQHNWYKLEDYAESAQYSYLQEAVNMKRLIFMYVPAAEDQGAALNFHLTAQEKRDVIASFNHPYNQQVLAELLQLLH